MAANTLALSRSGQQHQSIDPVFETSATDRRLPMAP
jgi:hypothetical protein